MSGSDDTRPRPRYGEYASTEEQRSRIQQPDLPYTFDQGKAPETVPSELPPAPEPPAEPVSPRPGRAADRVVTFALLGYGLINVVLTVTGLLDFPQLADQYFRIMGISGEFTNLDAGRLWGAIAAVVLVIAWPLTAWFSWRRLRAGRVSWWIPLVGGVVANLLVSACLLVPLFGDPAVTAFLTAG